MRKLTLFIALFVSITTFAQEDESVRNDEIQTLLGNKISHGGYGALLIQYSKFDNKDGLLIGGRGGWIINHGFTLGLCGYGFFNEAGASDVPDLVDDYCISGGYGGLLIEPTIASRFPVHITLPVTIGAGGVAYSQDYQDVYESDEWDPVSVDSDAFFIIQPGIEIELNLLKYVRIGLGVYYNFTSDINLGYESFDSNGKSEIYLLTESDVLQGYSYGITFKFGKF